jgi:hypothetical protein
MKTWVRNHGRWRTYQVDLSRRPSYWGLVRVLTLKGTTMQDRMPPLTNALHWRLTKVQCCVSWLLISEQCPWSQLELALVSFQPKHVDDMPGKYIPLQGWTGPRAPRGWRSQNLQKKSAHESGKIFSHTHPPFLPPQEISLILISITDWVDPRAIVRQEILSQRKMVSRMLLYVMYPSPLVILCNIRTWRYESLILTTEHIQNTVSFSPKIGGKGHLYSDSLTEMQARRGPYQMTVLPKCRPDVGPIKLQSYRNAGQTWAFQMTVLPKCGQT